jgi:uncharacterized membrane protein
VRLALVPLLLLAGALALDTVGALALRPSLWVAGHYLTFAGVVAGLAAVAARLLVRRRGAPSRGASRWRAAGYLLASLAGLALFALAWWLRGHPEVAPDPGILVFEATAMALLLAGAWLGRTP